MQGYLITEHHGPDVRDLILMMASNQKTALMLSCWPPFQVPEDAAHWHFIDDGLGGGALIDPKDEDHCFRADPRLNISAMRKNQHEA